MQFRTQQWGHLELDIEEFMNSLTAYPIPHAVLTIGGLLAVMIAILYVKDRDSGKYKILKLVGMIFGIIMAVVAYNTYGTTGFALSTSIIMVVAAFTLIIRPFKDVHFAVLIALLVMAVVYILLAELAGTPLEILSQGWYRVGIALVAGAIVFSLLHMAEAIVKFFGKLLNAWPVLLILGIVCIAEGIMTFMGYGSVYEFVKELLDR